MAVRLLYSNSHAAWQISLQSDQIGLLEAKIRVMAIEELQMVAAEVCIAHDKGVKTIMQQRKKLRIESPGFVDKLLNNRLKGTEQIPKLIETRGQIRD